MTQAPYRVINSQLICAQYDRTYPTLSHGEGVYLYDTSGKRYLDGLAGPGPQEGFRHLGTAGVSRA